MTVTMPAISLWNPWAFFVAKGFKKIETRSWHPPSKFVLSGTRIAIHAAKSWTRDVRDVCRQLALRECLPEAVNADLHKGQFLLGNGCILATCRIAEVLPTERVRIYPQTLGAVGLKEITAREGALGDFRPGRFAWVLDDVQELQSWVPVAGRQGFFNVTFEQGDTL